MAIPGWAPALFTEPASYLLPEPEIVGYSDTYRFGQVSDFFVKVVGDPLIDNRSGYRVIDIEIQIRHVFDTALLDRIE